MRLEGKPLGDFIKALQKGYSDKPGRFDQMMAIHLTKTRANYTLADDMPQRFFDVITSANMEGWTAELVAAALDATPGNPDLRKFARSVGLDPVPAAEATNLQKVVTERSQYHDAEVFLDDFDRRIDWTCRIAFPGGGGTGVLVADDLVLTNHHVMAKVITRTVQASAVTCIFDHKVLKTGTEISPGRRVGLHAVGVVASRRHSDEDTKHDGGAPAAHELDYALVRLAEPVGAQPLGTKGVNDPLGVARGHLQLSASPPAFEDNDPVVMLQHPQLPGKAQQEPVQLSIGSVLASPFKELRLRHNARSHPGSSGSPVFNADLAMIALHHAGDPVTGWEKPEWNQAIPIGKIVADLPAHGVGKFWDD